MILLSKFFVPEQHLSKFDEDVSLISVLLYFPVLESVDEITSVFVFPVLGLQPMFLDQSFSSGDPFLEKLECVVFALGHKRELEEDSEFEDQPRRPSFSVRVRAASLVLLNVGGRLELLDELNRLESDRLLLCG